MNALKKILMVVGGVFIVLFAVIMFLPDDTESTDKTSPEETSASDFYGNNDESGNSGTANGNGAVNPSGEVRELSSASFAKLVADYQSNPDQFIGDAPCVVDFYATWCGPCKQLSPLIEAMAQQYAGKVNVYKVDIDQASDVATAYGIESIPTLFFCSNGQIHRITGAPNESKLDELFSNLQ